MGKLGVLIVDDEPDMRALLRAMIEIANEGLSVADEAADGETALRAWRSQQPEVVLLDQRMPGLSGLETAEAILREDPDQAVIIFTAYFDDNIKAAAEALGVKACVPKTEATRLVNRLRECAAS